MEGEEASFLKRYGIGLLIETVLGLLEWFVNVLHLPFFMQAVLLSGIAAAWVLGETWRETPLHRRPDWRGVFIFWSMGTLYLFSVFKLLGVVAPQQVTVQLSSLPAERIVVTLPPPPTPTPRPTYTPWPTPTPIVVVVTPTPSPSPTLPYGYAKVCSDAPPSPFAVGRWGYICNQDKIILREKPSPRGKVLAVMEPGTKFVVIGGPECGDRRVWWQVRFQGNEQPYNNDWVGWMPESNPGGDEVYLCPRP